jgi:hypothetical protein
MLGRFRVVLDGTVLLDGDAILVGSRRNIRARAVSSHERSPGSADSHRLMADPWRWWRIVQHN